MTYTFKLSRRLAASRRLGMLSLLAVVAACAGDSTAPEVPAADPSDPVAVIEVTPDTLTLEVDQPVRFAGWARTEAADSTDADVEWSATGGTISPDGVFTASSAGVFKVVGRGRNKQADTSVVVVVAPQPTLASITVSPATTSLVTGGAQQFATAAKLSDGSTATVGLVWTATGGTVDAAGKYTAGSAAGQYRVVVANTDGTVADTAVVAVTEPAPAPAPVPVLASVTLTPGTASLVTGATQQFAAYGRMSTGDSVAVAVTFSATGGSITSGGLYTAGATTGTYRVIAAAVSGPADTTVVTIGQSVTAPAPSGSMGIPFGLFDLVAANVAPGPFTLSHDSYSSSNIVSRINAARANGVHLLLAMTNGSHSNYLTDGVFDRAKWEARMQTFNTAEIKQAIAAGVADGTILGASVMDEPHVSGAGDGNTWGPPGTMTKLRVDSLCRYVKALFPTLPTGVVHRHDVFEPQNSYYACEFIVSQYASRIGSVTAFRDGGLAMAKRDGIGILFSMNILNGGTQDKDGTWDCVGTGGLGTYSPNCRMTPEQVRAYGDVLGPAGCGFLMWRYDGLFMANPENQLAFRDIAARLATLPRKSCSRV